VQGKYMRTVLDLLQCTMSISYHVQIVYTRLWVSCRYSILSGKGIFPIDRIHLVLKKRV